MGSKNLNILYFNIFVILIFVFQGFLYKKTVNMDSLNKNQYKLSKKSEEIFQKSETEGLKEISKKDKKYFTDIVVFREAKDKKYSFIFNRDLIYSLSGKKYLDEKQLEDKIIYDSCDTPKNFTKFNKKYIFALKNPNTSKCYVFVSGNIEKILNGGLPTLWYVLIAIIFLVLSAFVLTPSNLKNKVILMILLTLYNIFFYIYNLKSLENINLKNNLQEITESNLLKIFLFSLIINLMFSAFYLTKLNSKLNQTLLKYKVPYLYILPGGIGILFLSFVPLFSGIILSFFRVKYSNYEFTGLGNYYEILVGGLKDISNPEGFYYTFFITVIWTVINIFFHLLIGMSIALILNDKKLKFKKIYSIIFIIPWAIPNYITALIWKSMFHKQFGSINNLLVFLGFERISWFTNTFTAFTANLLTNIWLGFPFMMVMTLGALQSIPSHLYDAAVMDGANKWQQFKYVTLPMLKPALLPSVILGIIWTFNMFNVIYLVSGGEPNGSTDILITEAYRWAFERNGRYGYSAAYATIIFIVLYLYNHITGKITRKGEAK